jgi:hypothetical protein
VLQSTNVHANAIVLRFTPVSFVSVSDFIELISTSLTARLLCDALVKYLNFGVDNFESALPARTVLAGCGGLTVRHCLDKLGDDDAAILTDWRLIHAVLRRSRVPKIKGGKH